MEELAMIPIVATSGPVAQQSAVCGSWTWLDARNSHPGDRTFHSTKWG